MALLLIALSPSKIQTSYRANAARGSFRRIRGMVWLHNLVDRDSVKNQASTTLSRLHSSHMVTEGRLRQKKLENQLKQEANIQGLEVEWNGGSFQWRRVLGQAIMNLARQTGDGAGWTAGLLLGLGKFESPHSIAPRLHRPSNQTSQ